jgi:hypothetical protein
MLGSAPALGWAWVVAPGTGDTQTGGFLYAHLVDARSRVGSLGLGGEPDAEQMRRVLELTAPAVPALGPRPVRRSKERTAAPPARASCSSRSRR